jgi:hypothetical protein
LGVINISISDVFVVLTDPIETVPSIVPLQPEVVEVVAIESDEVWLKAKFNARIEMIRCNFFIKKKFACFIDELNINKLHQSYEKIRNK